jgi:hypothetical protein
MLFPGPSLARQNTADGASNDSPVLLEGGERVLFIGNGYVGSEGGLHNHFRRTLARPEPALSIETDWPAMFNRPTLADMLTDEVATRIREGPDDLIVAMNGHADAMREVAGLIESSGRTMVLFSTWAENPVIRADGMEGFRAETHTLMDQARQFEKETGVRVAPSGLIFYDLLADPIEFPGLREDYLFVQGGSIQNDLGTLVNVSALYAVTTGRSPVGLPVWDPFPESLVAAIQERVWHVVQDWQAGNTVLKPVPRQVASARAAAQRTTQNEQTPTWPPLLEDGDHLFYVGNSFIGSEGGLNNHFRRMTTSASPPLTISDTSLIFWGQGLNRMYTGDVVREIESGGSDIVVVTSGPVEMLNRFKTAIEPTGAQMAVHMTWGRNPTINEGGLASFREQTQNLVVTMREFEHETGIPVVPCGLIFYDLVVDPPDVAGLRLDWVFMGENIHQNHIGTMANATAHYAVLTGRSPVGLPMWDPYPPELVQAVQERAWHIVKEWKAGRVQVKSLPE